MKSEKNLRESRFKNSRRFVAAVVAALMALQLLPAAYVSGAAPAAIVAWDMPATTGTPSLPMAATTNNTGADAYLSCTASGAFTYVAGPAVNSTGWDGGGKYFRFYFSTAGYKNIGVSYKQQSSNTGPGNFKAQYSLDGVSYADVYSYSVVNSFGAVSFALPADADDRGVVYVRALNADTVSVNGGVVASGGTDRIGVISVTGASVTGAGSAADVAASLAGGAVPGGTLITLSTATPGAQIHYTVNGGAPGAGSALYTGPIAVDYSAGPTFTLRAVAVDPSGQLLNSEVSTFTYTEPQLSPPVATPAAGPISAPITVALATTPGETALGGDIYYTTDNTAPDTGSELYTAPFFVSPGVTVRAVYAKAGYLTSNAAAFAYPLDTGESFQTDGTSGSVAEWNYAAAPTGNLVPATGGDMMGVSSLKATVKGADKTFTFSSSGLATSGFDAAVGNAWWMMSTSTTGFTNIKLSFRMRSSATGPRDFTVQASADQSAWVDAGAFSITNTDSLSYMNGSTTTFNFDLSPLAPLVSDKPNLYIRLLLASATSENGGTVASGGTNTANYFVISGDYILLPNQVRAAAADVTGAVPLGSSANFSSPTAGAACYISDDDGNTYVKSDSYTFTRLPVTLTVYAAKDGMINSRVRSFDYTQAKLGAVTSSPAVGAIAVGRSVSLAASGGAAIKYALTVRYGTADAVTLPEETYTAPIAVTADILPLRITAYAQKDGYLNSDPVDLDYTEKAGTGGERNYFGQLHSHTTNSDGAGTLDEAYAWARDVAHLDFFAVTDHSNSFDTAPAGDKAGTYNLEGYNASNPAWVAGRAAAKNATTDTFTGIYASEMTWSGGPGHINTFATPGFVSRNNTELNNKLNDAGLRAYYQLLEQTPESVSQFNHPGPTFGNFNNFAYWDPVADQRVTLCEVGNGEGAVGSGGYFRSYDQYNMALDKGWHVAPTNNQDNHKKGWGTANTCRDAIWTNDCSEAGVYQALRDRRVYATEVKDLDIVYTANGYNLGEIVDSVPGSIHFSASIKNPTAGNIVKTACIVTNGGKEIGTVEYDAQNAAFDWALNDPDPGYYYLKVTEQADGMEKYAVTAPVWFGKAEKIGITQLVKNTDVPVTTEPVTLTASFFNNEAAPAVIDQITYTDQDGNVLYTGAPNTPIAPNGGTADSSMSYTPVKEGDTTVTVTAVITLGGAARTFAQSISYGVADINAMTYIGIDAVHHNEYVSGNYAASMTNFTKLAAAYGVRAVQLNTEADLIAACANPKYKALVITAPTRRLTLPAGAYDYYSQAVLDAVAGYARSGGTLIISGWSDYYEPASPYVTGSNALPGAENGVAYQQNRLLKAIGSSLRLSDDASVDEALNPPPNQYRLYLPNTFNPGNPLTAGIVPAQTYSVYGGCTVYAADINGRPLTALPAGVSSVISGLPTTWAEDRDGDGYGLADPAQKPPRYGDSADAGRGAGTVLLNASETVDHGGTASQVIVSGGAFMSDFEIQATLDNYGTLPYSNYNILTNIIKAAAPAKVITSIAEAKKLPEGTAVTIEGTATSGVYTGGVPDNKGFFDCIYAQDTTGGINLFPVGSGVAEGQRIQATGTISSYEGEIQLAVTSLTVTDPAIDRAAPTALSTAEAMSPRNTGLLVRTQGVVSGVIRDGVTGAVNQFAVDDGSGPALVYINAYITSGTDTAFIADGASISVVGLASVGENFSGGDFLPRIRVRDRAEITTLAPPAPSAIAVSAPASTVKKGTSMRLSVRVSPAGADASVTWASSNESVASVSSAGVVTGLKTGTVRITAVSKLDPGVSYIFLIMVTA